MILVCPSCGTRYVVNPAAFTGGARQVRCARCSQEWQAEPPPEEQELPDDLPPVVETPQAVTPIPPGSNLPAIIGKIDRTLLLWSLVPVLIFALMLSAGLFFVYGRSTIVIWFPGMVETYNGMGLRVGELGAGLVIRNIRSEQRLESGAMMLALDGEVVNGAAYMQSVPIIQASALGTDNKPVAIWEMFANPIRLEPGGVATFSSTVRYPEATVVEVTLAFTEHEKQQAEEEEESAGGEGGSSKGRSNAGSHGGSGHH
ncbi:MAG: hypothetical protein GC131_07315 [Alphaproteobacteria bacterium]|nr:hypothetical protein [Alphaproteobacteria bacterium]